MPSTDPATSDLAVFARPRGTDLIGRTGPLLDWIDRRVERDLWPYRRLARTGVGPHARFSDATGRVTDGVNFASQDYLGLSADPRVVEAAVEAARRYGVHSGGSGALSGGTADSERLAADLAELVGLDHAILFPTGWAAGYGAVTGLVRPYDHVVLDELAHACLQAGAAAATSHVHRHAHLDTDALARVLARVRAENATCGILVITEGLYSMDADTPDLARTLELARAYGATLLVDVAHDLGASGPGGTGQLGLQGLLGEVDLVMGAFSKTFATNGGFLAANSLSALTFVTAYGGSYTFSNALSPLQVAVARAALDVVRAPAGDRLRERLLSVSVALREELAALGFPAMGVPSAVNPVHIGPEAVARVATTLLADAGVVANLVEFPGVARGSARLRLQAMATHDEADARRAARAVAGAVAEARNRVTGGASEAC